MSAFEIEIQELERGPIEKSIRPDRTQLEELFEHVAGEFRLAEGHGFSAEFRAQKTDSTVHVSGTVAGDFAFDCGRCLVQRPLRVDTELDFVLMSEAEWTTAYGGEDEIALKEDEMDVSYYEGETLDLAELIREAVLLEFPAFPQCPENLRDECDARYEERVGDETLDELEEQKVDLRWTSLKNLEVDEDGQINELDQDGKN